jgi:hypothetical protein
MRLGRLVLVVATLVTILVFPVLIRDALMALQLPNAYAATGPMDSAGRVYQNGNNGDDDDNDDGNNDDGDDDDDNDNENNDESDNEGEDNENDDVECYASLNDNEDEVPCDFEDNGNYDEGTDNGNYDGANDNVYTPPPPSASAPGTGSIPASRHCFGVQETGEVHLNLEGGSIVVKVVSPGLAQATWLELDDIDDVSTLPALPAGTTMLDHLAWQMNAGSGCDGGATGTIGAVNLGIPYNVSADKSKLQIVMLKGGAWVEVMTVPDPNPNNPYISSTITETGTYAVIQKP